VKRPLIRALLLDFDGIVAESERENVELARVFFRERFGIEITADDERSVYGFPWPETFAALFGRYGIAMSRAEAWPLLFRTKLAWLAGHPVRIATGLPELLRLPVAKALVSGSHREEIEAMLASAGHPRLGVDVVITRDDVNRGKPDPEGFLAACSRLGVPPASAFVFEDSRPGIAAARAAGMPVGFVRELSPEDNAGLADVAFDTLAEAVPWVRERLGTRQAAGTEGTSLQRRRP
jgi:HAD superfamily hydrolase (TIGR01509 family)